MTDVDDVIDNYLDDLFAELRGRPADIRRMMAETEEHLRSAIAVAVTNGVSPDIAATEAVERFGTAAQVASAWTADSPAEPLNAFLRRIGAQLVPLIAVGLLAIGASGIVARAMTAIWGRTFMFADPPGTIYPSAACHHWLSIHPAAGTCTSAFLAESQSDALLARYAAGASGLVLFGCLALVRHRRGLPVLQRPALLHSFTGAAVFLLAALALFGLSLDSIQIADARGAGQWLSAAIVSVPVAAYYGLAFLRSGRRSLLTEGSASS